MPCHAMHLLGGRALFCCTGIGAANACLPACMNLFVYSPRSRIQLTELPLSLIVRLGAVGLGPPGINAGA
jgi:hypothetical protein